MRVQKSLEDRKKNVQKWSKKLVEALRANRPHEEIQELRKLVRAANISVVKYQQAE